MHRFAFPLLLLTFFTLGRPLWALSLDATIEAALLRSEAGLEATRAEGARQAEAIEAGRLDNPELQVDAVRPGGQSQPNIEGEFYQPLKLSLLTGERGRLAESLRAQAGSERAVANFKTRAEAGSLYLKLWTLQARQKLFEDSLAEISELSAVVTRSAASGQTAPAARELFAGDREQLVSTLKGLAAESKETANDLAQMTGLPIAGEVLEAPRLGAIPPLDRLVSLASARTTWRTALRDRMESAEQRLAVAQSDALLPEIGPRLIYARDPTASQDTVGVGIALRIPLWDQNDAERTRARADASMARVAHERAQQLPLADSLAALRAAAIERAERRDELCDHVLPRYRKSYALTRAMYKQGQADALALWQVREKLYQTEETALAAATDAYLARLRLEAEVGGALEAAP